MTEVAVVSASAATAMTIGVLPAFDYRNCAIHADEWMQSFRNEGRPDVPRPTVLRWAGGALVVLGVVQLVAAVRHWSGF
ncbi:hypothetical protein ACPA54_01160 [Uniformispora flossi]|uniref:hypothetical protein n=1 Tax=Uniformispora flossi TaxID=3390723 RepID=UPI003C2DDB40